MNLTEKEKKDLEVKMSIYGTKKYTHAFFDSMEYESFRNAVISGVPHSEDKRLNIAFCDIHDVLEAGRYVVCKHTNGIDIRVPYTNGDYLSSSIVKRFGKIPKPEDYEEIFKYIKNNYDLPKVTDIPVSFEMTDSQNGYVVVTAFFDSENINMEFFDNLPVIACNTCLFGDCNDLMKTIYVHEIYHALVNRHKNNMINILNNEMVSIFMEKVAALDLDSSFELLKLKTLDRLISLKGDVLNRESLLYYDHNHLDIVMSEGYILSTLEATALFSTYKNGSNKVRRQIDTDINNVLLGERTVEDIIDKYEATPEKGSRLVKRQINNLF